MSKRSERREAERLTRKLAFQQLRQERAAPSPEPTATEPPTISEAQLAANRANSQLSTGPTTPVGKAASSRNALKHGLTGQTVLLPTDDPAEYQQKLDVYLDRYHPATEEELRLVQSLVDSYWRLNRLRRLETGLLAKGQMEFAGKFEDTPEPRRASLIEVEAYLKYEKSIRNLHTQEARLIRRVEKDQAELIRLQTLRKREEQIASEPSPTQPPTRSSAPNGFEFSNRSTRQPNGANLTQKQLSRAA